MFGTEPWGYGDYGQFHMVVWVILAIAFAFFPVFFPVMDFWPSETGSYLTAHTTIQSPQTARFRYDAK